MLNRAIQQSQSRENERLAQQRVAAYEASQRHEQAVNERIDQLAWVVYESYRQICEAIADQLHMQNGRKPVSGTLIPKFKDDAKPQNVSDDEYQAIRSMIPRSKIESFIAMEIPEAGGAGSGFGQKYLFINRDIAKERSPKTFSGMYFAWDNIAESHVLPKFGFFSIFHSKPLIGSDKITEYEITQCAEIVFRLLVELGRKEGVYIDIGITHKANAVKDRNASIMENFVLKEEFKNVNSARQNRLSFKYPSVYRSMFVKEDAYLVLKYLYE